MRTTGISCAPDWSSVRQISPHTSCSRSQGIGIPGFCIYAFALNQVITTSIFNFLIIGISGRSAVLSFVSWIILSLVEVLITQMIFWHLSHCQIICIPITLVGYHLLMACSIALNIHPESQSIYRKPVQMFQPQILHDKWLFDIVLLQNIPLTISEISYFPRLTLRFFFLLPPNLPFCRQ